MDAHTWLTNEVKQVFKGTTKHEYYDNSGIFYEHLNDLKADQFEFAHLIRTVLMNQSAMEIVTSVCERISVSITNHMERALLADSIQADLKGKRIKLSDKTKKKLSESQLSIPRASSILANRDELALKMLQLYAYNASIDAINEILDVPELTKFKIRRINTHTPLDWHTATFDDIDAYFDGGHCQYLLEDYMAYFNVFIAWSLKQERFDFLHTKATVTGGVNAIMAGGNKEDIPLVYWNPMPFEDFRPTNELIDLYIKYFKSNERVTFEKILNILNMEYYSDHGLVIKIFPTDKVLHYTKDGIIEEKNKLPRYTPKFMSNHPLYG